MNRFEDLYSTETESKEGQNKIPIPKYDPADQFNVAQLEQEYPEWSTHGDDAEIVAVNYERTRALRKIGDETGIGRDIMFEIGGKGLEWAIDHTPREVGMEYDSHGIAGKSGAIEELDTLLKEGIKKDRLFYSMNFVYEPEASEGFGADRPFTAGGFIVVAERNKKLQNDGIKYVVVGEEYVRVLDLLKRRYPQVIFIPWHEAPKVLTNEVNKAKSREIVLELSAGENMPTYHIPKRFGRDPVVKSEAGLIPQFKDADDMDADDVW